VLFGAVLYLGGTKFAKELLFPIGFLVFMLPLPQVLIIGAAFKLKMLAAHASTISARMMGINVTRAGSTIYYPGGFLLVGDPCSGLRSLITFLAIGALFTQITAGSFWRRNILFISAIPVALLSNVMRLTLLIVVGYIYGQKVALGFIHDFSGFMVFAVGFAGLAVVSKVLRCEFEF